MKNIFIIITMFIPLILSACQNDCGSDCSENSQTTFTVLKSDAPRDTTPDASAATIDAYVAANTDFATNLYQEMINTADGNVFFSPHSINVALMMTYAGARGDTAAQMADLLRFDPADGTIHDTLNALDLHLSGLGSGDPDEFRLSVVNATWGQDGFSFEDAFLDILATSYGAGLNILDFLTDPEAARGVINDWVEDQTEGRIEDLLPEGSVTSDTRLVLTNAIYFKADWEYQFSDQMTHDADFTRLDGTVVTTDMMSQDEIEVPYFANAEFQMVELPYKGLDTSMVILLPADGQFDAVESEIAAAFLNGIVDQMTLQSVMVQLPKFSFTFDVSLKAPLMAIGLTDAFDPALADLTGMNPAADLYIQDVVHKAFVAVDEDGTEAAAATGVIVGDTSVPMNIVTANRPFFFFIRDRVHGTILFFGRVLDPTV
ncbi:MAG: serpin family protein [Deltaproteobacteria bacterium HGW-Deltaproteobacteria-22]|jgi:serpin B|nr:MAG: serpin family protein [Deltaproteobacteria bacterium HGW-Deltaproteobacteria-22]